MSGEIVGSLEAVASRCAGLKAQLVGDERACGDFLVGAGGVLSASLDGAAAVEAGKVVASAGAVKGSDSSWEVIVDGSALADVQIETRRFVGQIDPRRRPHGHHGKATSRMPGPTSTREAHASPRPTCRRAPTHPGQRHIHAPQPRSAATGAAAAQRYATQRASAQPWTDARPNLGQWHG